MGIALEQRYGSRGGPQWHNIQAVALSRALDKGGNLEGNLRISATHKFTVKQERLRYKATRGPGLGIKWDGLSRTS